MDLAEELEDEVADRVRSVFRESAALKLKVLEREASTIVRMAREVSGAVVHGGKILLCGNGGSAADAQHLAADMLLRLRPHVDRDGVPALALALDSSSLTAWGNDYEFDGYYERMVQTKGMRTLGFLGGDGGD